MSEDTNWRAYRGDGKQEPERLAKRLVAPPWRVFATRSSNRAEKFLPPKGVVEAVNAALILRRPVLVTGDPGTGKSSLAFSIARELDLGDVLTWNVNSRSTLVQGLYDYDAVARLRAANLRAANPNAVSDPNTRADPEDIGAFITLGAVGTAFIAPKDKPRVVLIDEIDKSDVDLPNDLLHVFEDGEFEIPELRRIAKDRPAVEVATLDRKTVAIEGGVVQCAEFPIVVITSNGERDLPPAFLRRCLRIDLPKPDTDMLREIVMKHLPDGDKTALEGLLTTFKQKTDAGGVLATDQLLNAFFLVTRGNTMSDADRTTVESIVLRELDAR